MVARRRRPAERAQPIIVVAVAMFGLLVLMLGSKGYLMRGVRAVVMMASAVVLVGLAAITHVSVYGHPGSVNGGVVVTLSPDNWYGLELWGHPGFFHNVD